MIYKKNKVNVTKKYFYEFCAITGQHRRDHRPGTITLYVIPTLESSHLGPIAEAQIARAVGSPSRGQRGGGRFGGWVRHLDRSGWSDLPDRVSPPTGLLPPPIVGVVADAVHVGSLRRSLKTQQRTAPPRWARTEGGRHQATQRWAARSYGPVSAPFMTLGESFGTASAAPHRRRGPRRHGRPAAHELHASWVGPRRGTNGT